MDGKHVIIRCPKSHSFFFFSIKKITFSIVLFAIVDADYNYIYIGVGTNGRTNDALVFQKRLLIMVLSKMSKYPAWWGIF